MSPENRSLMMRANRLLGAGLVEHNLVKIEDLEKANERLLEIIATNQPRQATVLGVLAYELKVIREEDVLQHLVESEGLGLVDLRGYEPPDDTKKGLDLDACWSTWSVPFDQEEDFTFIATAYYLSPAVRTYWEKKFDGPILWFGTTLEGIAEHLDRLSSPTSSKAPFPTAGAPASAPAAPISNTTPPMPVPAAPVAAVRSA
ncbi:MAG TPA: hypothetical protein VII43_02825 [Opitutaceae bacterium]